MIRETLNDGWTDPPADLQLAEGHVHVWTAHLGRLQINHDVASHTLSEAENQRAASFRHERDRTRFLRSHFLLRCLLARYLEMAPRDVRITSSGSGKPAVDGNTSLRFNMSHARHMAIYAFASGDEVGIDIESNQPAVDVDGITERCFAPAEIHAIAREPAGRRLQAFIRCWVRKEAVVKASGCGLRVPLRDVDIAGDLLDRGCAIARTPGNSTPWHVSDLPPMRGYSAALAVACTPRDISCWRITERNVRGSTCQ